MAKNHTKRHWCSNCDKKDGSLSWLTRLITIHSKRSNNSKSGFSTKYVRAGIYQCPKCKSLVLEKNYPENYMMQRLEQ